MSEDELKQYWFYPRETEQKNAPELTQSKYRPRIHEFKEVGWVDPFAYLDQELEIPSDVMNERKLKK